MTDEQSHGVRPGWEPYGEEDYGTTCTVCGERFDRRKRQNMGKHLHDASGVKFVEAFEQPFEEY